MRRRGPSLATRIGEGVRTGAWVNSERLTAYPVIFLTVGAVVFALGAVLGSGMSNALGDQPVGTDFLSFYGVSMLILDGRAADAYSAQALHAVQREIAGPGSPFYGWLYPPIAMLLVAPLSLLPYGAALVAWLVGTGAVFVTGLWRIVPGRRSVLPILAFPAVFLTLGHGQNALLSAGLLAWSLTLLPRIGGRAGGLAGALVFKPQLGLLLPVAFLAGRHLRAFAGAAIGVVSLMVVSLAVFGVETWTAFLQTTDLAVDVLEEGLVAWEKMISAFAASSLIGLPTTTAWVVQGIVSLAAAVLVWLVWSGDHHYSLKTASLALGTVLATPFALDYEATFLGITIAALVARGLEVGFLDWEKSALVALWVSPLLWRVFSVGTGLPLAFPVLLAAAALLVRRLAAERDGDWGGREVDVIK